MKTKLNLMMLVLTLALTPACNSPTIPANGDQVVIRAQQTKSIAFTTLDAYLKFEYDHKATLLKISPDFHSIAERIRNGKTLWFQALDLSLNIYRQAKTPENAELVNASVTKLNTEMAIANQATVRSNIK